MPALVPAPVPAECLDEVVSDRVLIEENVRPLV